MFGVSRRLGRGVLQTTRLTLDRTVYQVAPRTAAGAKRARAEPLAANWSSAKFCGASTSASMRELQRAVLATAALPAPVAAQDGKMMWGLFLGGAAVATGAVCGLPDSEEHQTRCAGSASASTAPHTKPPHSSGSADAPAPHTVTPQALATNPGLRSLAQAGPSRPVFTNAQVAAHDGVKSLRTWVSYGGGVYDITEFIENHPGGASKIKLAAGKGLEPFWR